MTPTCAESSEGYACAGGRVQSLGFGFWGWVFGVGVWGLGFGVWGLGLGVWGLRFGAWDSGQFLSETDLMEVEGNSADSVFLFFLTLESRVA